MAPQRGRERDPDAPDPALVRDEDGSVRIIRSGSDHSGMTAAAFDPIRQAGQGKPAVLIRLLEALRRVADCARCDVQREALRTHADRVLATAEQSISVSTDRDSVRERHRDLIAALRG